MKYSKPFLTYEQQADKLIEAGLVANRRNLIEHLQDVGYYRLSGYWHIYKEVCGKGFRKGALFEKVWSLYTFDRQFRLVVLDAVERVEIYIRTQLAHLLAEESGAFGYEGSCNLPRLKGSAYDEFLGKCRTAFKRSREPFALHFKEQYGDEHELPPYWILVNLMDFGMVVTLYRGAPVGVRNEIAKNLGVSSRVLESWLVSINTVRNICAHHGRLWNRTIGTPPMIPSANKDVRWHDPYEVRNEKAFAILTVMSCLLAKIAPDTHWRKRLLKLLESRDESELRRMGFTRNWQDCPFWKPWL